MAMAGPSILVIDNFDSFTFTLVDYLRTLGAGVEVVRSDAVSVEGALGGPFDGWLVSPGPGAPEDAGVSVPLAREAVARGVPYLGICLGHQALALACGSAVERVEPVHGKVTRVRHDGSGLFAGLPETFRATRYHSLAVPQPASSLIANAWSETKLVMAMRHERAPAYGIQFHPESVASEHGNALLRAFLDICERSVATKTT